MSQSLDAGFEVSCKARGVPIEIEAVSTTDTKLQGFAGHQYTKPSDVILTTKRTQRTLSTVQVGLSLICFFIWGKLTSMRS